MIAFKTQAEFLNFILQSCILYNISFWDWADWIRANKN
jgi:hypothetical protein